MIHTFENNGYRLCLDENSGSVHVLDDISFEVLRRLEAGKSASVIREELAGRWPDEELDEVLAEMLPQSTQESRRALMGKIPTAVRMMLRRSSKESLQSMLAGMPPAMREKMFSRASG